EQEQLVGNRVEQLAEVAHRVVATREPPVQHVRKRGDQEDDERDDLGPIALDERKQCDDRREADTGQRDDIREGPAHRTASQLSVFSTSLLTAFNVSKTPSPRTATPSMYGARPIHSPAVLSTRFSPGCAGSGVSFWRAASSIGQPGFSAAWRSLIGAALGRSRLL